MGGGKVLEWHGNRPKIFQTVLRTKDPQQGDLIMLSESISERWEKAAG